MTSLINQVVNELERKEQATQTPELPLFAAADGLQRRRRMRAAIVAIAATGVALTASAMYLSDLKQKIPPIGDVAPLAMASDKLALSVESTSPVVVPVDKKISHSAQRQELLVSEVVEKSGSPNDRPLTSVATKAERGAVDSRALDTAPTAEVVAEETKLAFANTVSVPTAASSSLQKEQPVAEIKQMPKAPTAAQIDRQINKRAISVRQSSGDAAAKALLIREIGKRYDLPDSAAQLLALQLVSNDASSMAPLVQQYAKAFPEQQRFAVLLIRYYIDTAQMNKIDQVITGLPASLRADQKIMELYAAALQQRGDYSASAKVYAQLLVKDGGNGRWWMAYAVALDASQDTGQAKQAYRRALATGQLDTTLSQYASQRLAMML